MKSFYVAVCLLGASAISVAAQNQPGSRPNNIQIERGSVMIDQEPAGYLGVEPKEVTKDNFKAYGLNEVRGVVVERVFENSPAEKSGFQKGDIIVKFGGDVVSSARKLQRLVSETAPDHNVAVTVLRGGKEVELNVTIGKRDGFAVIEGGLGPMGQGDGRTFELRVPRIEGLPPMGGGNIERRVIVRGGDRRAIGVGVAPLTKQLGDYFGVSDGKGLLVNEVRENSPAAKAGIKAGDVIVQADGKAVSDTEELVEAINAKKEGEVVLNVVRNKKKETVKVVPETVKDDGPARRVEEIILNGPIGAEPIQPLRRMMGRPQTDSAPIM